MSQKSYSEFDAHCDEAAVCLEAMADQLGQLRQSGVARFLRSRAKALRQRTFRILVMGQFNAGKSTLLNAMLRTDVLPTKIFPSTAILTFIRYGEDPKATIFFTRSKEPRSLTVEDFNAAYCLKPGEPEALKSQRFAEVDHAVVEYPIPLCRHGVELVDSPGLNEVEHREKITLDYLHEADAVIFVFHASSFWTDCERRYLDDHVLPAGLDHIFFLVNWWDLVEGNPESAADLWARTRAKLTPYCQLDGKNLFDQRVFRLSAENARIARQRDDQVLLEKSGLPTFEERLADFILRGRGAAILRRALRHAEIASREADDAVELRLAAYEEEVGELEKRLGEIQPKFEQLRELRKQIAARIDSRCQRERDKLFLSYEEAMKDMIVGITRDASRFELPGVGNLSALSPAGLSRLQSALETEVRDYILARESAWQRKAEGDVQAAIGDLLQDMDHYAARFEALVREIRKGFGGEAVSLPKPEAPHVSIERWLLKSPGPTNLRPRPDSLKTAVSVGNGALTGASLIAMTAATGVVFSQARKRREQRRIQGEDDAALAGGAVVAALAGAFLAYKGAKAVVRASQAKGRILQELSRILRERMPAVVAQSKDSMGAAIERAFQGLSEGLCNAMDSEIDDLESSILEIVENRRRAEHELHHERCRVQEIQSEVKELCKALELLVQHG